MADDETNTQAKAKTPLTREGYLARADGNFERILHPTFLGGALLAADFSFAGGVVHKTILDGIGKDMKQAGIDADKNRDGHYSFEELQAARTKHADDFAKAKAAKGSAK